jgi:hypothetical protein
MSTCTRPTAYRCHQQSKSTALEVHNPPPQLLYAHSDLNLPLILPRVILLIQRTLNLCQASYQHVENQQLALSGGGHRQCALAVFAGSTSHLGPKLGWLRLFPLTTAISLHQERLIYSTVQSAVPYVVISIAHKAQPWCRGCRSACMRSISNQVHNST